VEPGEVRPGAVYVLGFSSYLRYARFPAQKGDDPEGPKVIDLPGVGPALFEDSPAVRQLVRAPQLSAAEVRNAALAQLARPDRRSRRLAAFELFFRPPVRAAFTAQHADQLAVVLNGTTLQPLEPLTHDFLLRAAALLPAPLQGSWVTSAARRAAAAQESPQLDLSSPVPALLNTALRLLTDSRRPDDAALAARFLTANNAAVAEAALKVVEKLAPGTALDHVERALQQPGLADDTRRLLERFRKRQPAAAAVPGAPAPDAGRAPPAGGSGAGRSAVPPSTSDTPPPPGGSPTTARPARALKSGALQASADAEVHPPPGAPVAVPCAPPSRREVR
ncbi:MAG TPA: hypothetical protein VEG34_16465, partial [Thermoanaerobaculia bacterium]|nr:hypothetical protein [Thermoanaerobaculia bacterium]